MNLRIGRLIKNCNNKILVSSSSFNIGTNLKINLDDKPCNKHNKPDIKSRKEDKQGIKMIKTKPDMNEITNEEEKAAVISLQYNECSNDLFPPRSHNIRVYQNSNTCYKCLQILR